MYYVGQITDMLTGLTQLTSGFLKLQYVISMWEFLVHNIKNTNYTQNVKKFQFWHNKDRLLTKSQRRNTRHLADWANKLMAASSTIESDRERCTKQKLIRSFSGDMVLPFEWPLNGGQFLHITLWWYTAYVYFTYINFVSKM